MSECLSLRCYSSAQAVDRGEICLQSICQASWPLPTTTLDRKGTSERRRMFGELRVLLFVCFRSVHGWMGMDVWVNVFRMPYLCADSGPWRMMSRA